MTILSHELCGYERTTAERRGLVVRCSLLAIFVRRQSYTVHLAFPLVFCSWVLQGVVWYLESFVVRKDGHSEDIFQRHCVKLLSSVWLLSSKEDLCLLEWRVCETQTMHYKNLHEFQLPEIWFLTVLKF
jgi:hypothetical protein